MSTKGEKGMKLSDKQRWGICIGLAALLIGVALFQIVTGIDLPPSIMKYTELIALLGCLYLIMIYPRQQAAKEVVEKEEMSVVEELDEE